MGLQLTLILLVLMLEGMKGQGIVAVEGLSMNVNILCDLDRQFHPLYWEIQGRVYDLYSVPGIFRVRGYEAITITAVDRRMDGWRFQCFTIDPNDAQGRNPGLITTLSVVYDQSTEGPDKDVDLLQSSLQGRLILHYQELQFTLETVSFGWLYSTSAPCTVSEYRINIYTQNEISGEIQGDLTALRTFTTTGKNITILKDSSSNANYFGISAANCATSAYYYALLFNGTTNTIHVSGNSATFEIPEHLRNDRSIQLIWSKDPNTQCVCPPVEQFISQCACNIENPNSNLITIENNAIAISNLTQMMDEGEVTLHFVYSVSSGCRDTCNLRSIIGVYKIIITQGYPQPPITSYDDNMFCFTIPDNPIHPEVYEVNLTDSTGSLTTLSGVYNISRCLAITSDLYPDVCGPFQLSVAALNSVGREVAQLTILPSSTITEPTPCDCYQQKEKIEVTSTTTATVAHLTLNCEYSEYRAANFVISLIISQDNNSTNIRVFTVSCNSTMTASSLTPSTSYTVNTILDGSQLACSLHQFRTNQTSTATAETKIIVLSVIVPLLLIVIVVCASVSTALFLCSRRNKKETKLVHSETEQSLAGGTSPNFRFTELSRRSSDTKTT